MKVKSEREVAQLCPPPSDPMDCNLSGSSIHGICQARVLEWGAIALGSSNQVVLFLICSSSYILDSHSLLDISFANIFSHFQYIVFSFFFEDFLCCA